MAKKKRTIHGLVFKCDECGKRFAVGSKGIDPITKRITEHMRTTRHMNIPPVKGIKGLTYTSTDGNISCVYDGKQDFEGFLNSVKSAVRENGTNMVPQLELTL